MAQTWPGVVLYNQDGTIATLSSGPIRGTLTDRSSTITSGGTSQQLAPTNTNRSYLFIYNDSAGTLRIDFGTAAVMTSPSIPIASGGAFVMEGSFVATGAVNIIGATTGQAFVSRES